METLPLSKFFIDLIINTCALVLMFYLSHGIRPYDRGFFCGDESILYPNLPSTVSAEALHAYGILLPVISIVIIEFMTLRSVSVRRSQLWKFEIPGWLTSAYSIAGVHLFGYIATHIVTDVIKNIIGRLRPCFIMVCQPSVNCSSLENRGRYILPTQFDCHGDDADVWDARKSFPSGHSSNSMYAMMFLALYLQYRFKWRGSHLMRLTLQIAVLLLSVMTAMSRVSNYRHHWSDVLVGILLGAVFAVAMFFLGTNVWKENHAEVPITAKEQAPSTPAA